MKKIMTKKLSSFEGSTEKSNYLREIESLRGVAVLLVFFFHVVGILYGTSYKPSSFLLSYVAAGKTGVTLFFVLSGFLLSFPYIRSLQRSQKFSPISSYFFSRFIRIIPLYYLVVIISGIFSNQTHIIIDALTFQYVNFEMFPYSVTWWTLSTEVQFYIFLPVFYIILSKGRLGVGIILLAFLIWAFLYWHFILANTVNIYDAYFSFFTKSLFGRLPAFLIGMFSAFIYCSYTNRQPKKILNIKRQIAGSFLTLLSFLTLGAILVKVTQLGLFESELNWHIHHTYEAICWSIIILSFIFLQPLGSSIVVNRFFCFAGRISYSMYLLHMPIAWFVIHPRLQKDGSVDYFNSVWFYITPLIALIITFIVSAIVYQYIEAPLLKLKKKLK